jgi:hypothetical protein
MSLLVDVADHPDFKNLPLPAMNAIAKRPELKDLPVHVLAEMSERPDLMELPVGVLKKIAEEGGDIGNISPEHIKELCAEEAAELAEKLAPGDPELAKKLAELPPSVLGTIADRGFTSEDLKDLPIEVLKAMDKNPNLKDLPISVLEHLGEDLESANITAEELEKITPAELRELAVAEVAKVTGRSAEDLAEIPNSVLAAMTDNEELNEKLSDLPVSILKQIGERPELKNLPKDMLLELGDHPEWMSLLDPGVGFRRTEFLAQRICIWEFHVENLEKSACIF